MEKYQMSWDFICKEYGILENKKKYFSKLFISVFYIQKINNFSIFL